MLYSFKGRPDGCYPQQGLVIGKSGSLYGTTNSCGRGGHGTIFKLDRAGKLTTLHSFNAGLSDGGNPMYGHLTMDKSGNLYGVTTQGGYVNLGALYELSKNGTFRFLHSFECITSDGCNPVGSVVEDRAGNLYGATSDGGLSSKGTIWKMSKERKETILHNFVGGQLDGCLPQGGVAQDSKGNLYGVAAGCGVYGQGALYELSSGGTFTLLHSFEKSNGLGPIGEVLLTTSGTLFGTNYAGDRGKCDGYDPGCGTVWSYVVKPLP